MPIAPAWALHTQTPDRRPHRYEIHADGRIPALVIMAAAALLAGYGAAGRKDQEPGVSATQSLFGPFAGYTWNGPVQQVGATVVVPGVVNGSPQGYAGTWIGAEGDVNPKTLSAPFFQVGVNELRTGQDATSARAGYFAFWSSTGLGFHPRLLFWVNPGDSVELSMTLAEDRWRISAKDDQTGSASTFNTGSVGGSTFDQAAWLQEDVSNSRAQQLSYPNLGAAVFSGLKVDDANPRARNLLASWMSAGTRTFGPTPPGADAFAVQPVSPSAAGLRYQRIALAVDLSALPFEDGMGSWSAHTKPSTIRAVSGRFARVQAQSIREFTSYRWPKDVRGLIGQMVAESRRSDTAALKLADSSPVSLAKASSVLARTGIAISELGDEIRARLHVPHGGLSGPAMAKYIRAHSD
jgi:hypothetical protein